MILAASLEGYRCCKHYDIADGNVNLGVDHGFVGAEGA